MLWISRIAKTSKKIIIQEGHYKGHFVAQCKLTIEDKIQVQSEKNDREEGEMWKKE